RPRGPQQDLVLLAQLLDELHDMHVIREPVVIELFQPDTVDPKAARQTADLRVALKHGSSDAVLAEFIGGGKTAETGADDDGVGPRVPCHNNYSLLRADAGLA